MRQRTADAIDDLLNVQGATHVTIKVDAEAARRLADDLRWCQHSRAPETAYRAKVSGSVEQ